MTPATLTTTARRLNACHPQGGKLPPLAFLTDRRRLPDPLAVACRLPRGSLVILRDGDLAADDRLALARQLADTARRRGLCLLIAGDSRLARRVGAAGVHWPERCLPTRVRGFATAAAHSPAALRRAQRAGVAAAFLSPVLPTDSHPGAPCLGVVRFAALVRRAGLPIYALGGIDGRTAPRLAGSGAVGIGAIGAFAG